MAMRQLAIFAGFCVDDRMAVMRCWQIIRPKGKTANPDVVGTLRYCNGTRISIDHSHEQVGDIAVHFPVIGYVMTPIDLAV